MRWRLVLADQGGHGRLVLFALCVVAKALDNQPTIPGTVLVGSPKIDAKSHDLEAQTPIRLVIISSSNKTRRLLTAKS